jgi:transcriptional regulator with XRE-family HTH domain
VSAPQPERTEIGAAIRAARRARGWTQTDLAEAVLRQRVLYRLPPGEREVAREQISKIECGERTAGPQWRRLLAGGLEVSEEYLFGVSIDTELPRPLLIDASATESKIRQIRAQRDVHAAADHLYGPAYAKRLVDIDLETIEGLLRNSHEGLRAEVRAEAARIAELGGWLAQDSGDLTTAERLTGRAEDYARPGDPAIRALILMRRSNVTFRRDPHLACDLAAEAARVLPKRGHERLAASIARQHAIAALAAKDAKAYTRHITRAGDFAQAPLAVGDLAPYADPGYVASEHASGLLVLGQPEQAADLLRTHVPRWPETQQRDQAVALARLVRALTATGEYTGAIETLAVARAVYREAPSVRARRELRLTGRLIISHARRRPAALPLTELQRRIRDALQGDPPDA